MHREDGDGVREIIFNGQHSLADHSLTIAPYPDTRIGTPQPRTLRETVAYMDGSYDFSAMSGGLIYDDRTLVYTFNLHGESREDLETMRGEILAWLTSAVAADLYDDDFPDRYFTNVTLTSLGDLEFVSRNGRNAKLCATFTAAPKRRKAGTVIMTVAEFAPASNVSEYVWLYAGDRLYYNSIGSTDIFDTKNITNSNKSITATVNVTNWDKGIAKIQVPSFIEQVSARIDGNILTPGIVLDSQYYYVVGSGWHVLALTFTARSGVSISDSMAQLVTAVGFSSGTAAKTPPAPDNLMISAADSLPQVTVNGSPADTDNISLNEELTVMKISNAKGDKLKLVYDDTEDMI